jgi:hypothetical protein
MELRRAGLEWSEIATRLELSVSTVRTYHYDPQGVADRRRRARYAGACAECGGPTSGAHGPRSTPARCQSCARTPSWSDEAIVDALRTAAARLDRTPTVYDLSPALAQRDGRTSLIQSDRGHWPSTATIARRYGSFRAGLRAAGLEPIDRGGVRRWSREAILAGLRSDTARRGRPPRAREWQRSGADHPSASTAVRAFGAWSAALRAAGLGGGNATFAREGAITPAANS